MQGAAALIQGPHVVACASRLVRVDSRFGNLQGVVGMVELFGTDQTQRHLANGVRIANVNPQTLKKSMDERPNETTEAGMFAPDRFGCGR